MSEAPQEQPQTYVTLTFNRELSNDEVDQIRQRTDALDARVAAAPSQAAHHHDVTP